MADGTRQVADVVTLKAMRFHTRIGVLPHEAEIAQSVEVDLSVVVSRPAGAAGPRGVVDYRELYDIAAEVMAQEHHLYLEDVAEQIAARALQTVGVTEARVAVRKPHVALPGPLAYAEVAIERRGRS
jgi:7,8-dihydroneopterin aldolase/epimerase/oxygenase